MNCTDCQDKFSEILASEAPRETTTAFKAHLASCSNCASAFNGFNKTVETLKAIPEQAVPSDFLIGINAKLDIKPFAKFSRWFSFMGHHKLTASATMATLIVGIISATILQTTPEVSQPQLTSENSTYTQAITTRKGLGANENNYYPGVPYLAKRKPEQQTASPIVQFASTNTKPYSGYYDTQNQRGSPHDSVSTRYTSLHTVTNPKPDFHIFIHPASTGQQQAITHRIASNTDWKTHLNNKTLFVTLTDQQLPEFQQLFPPSAPPHKNLDFSPLTEKKEQNLFTIAISFN